MLSTCGGNEILKRKWNVINPEWDGVLHICTVALFQIKQNKLNKRMRLLKLFNRTTTVNLKTKIRSVNKEIRDFFANKKDHSLTFYRSKQQQITLGRC